VPNRLRDSVSPYLRSHADNPVDWWPWGQDAFAEAIARDVPVLISIGYSTCHWCHVMARESFSDPALAAYLNEHFVSIKVDREEHPDVDSSYLAAAGAFTDQLGWPLTVFATPTGRAFYAGTYFPPVAVQGLPSFRQVLEAMVDAWTDRRSDVEDTAGRLAAALVEGSRSIAGGVDSLAELAPSVLSTDADFAGVVTELLQYEDADFGGFGGAPKFPVAPVLGFLIDRAESGDDRARALAHRTLDAMATSPLRDPVEGGFFRYATRPDWSEPHYERMLYDNALLLDSYARLGSAEIAEGVASFLLNVLRLPSGGFASAQDSESTVDGVRVEGGYYLLDASARRGQRPPALDDKVLTGWNGLAIGALATAGSRLGHPEWIAAAIAAADLVSAGASSAGEASGGESSGAEAWTDRLVRARIGARASSAKPTLEDFGMLAAGLIELALATGEVRFAVRARDLVTSTTVAGATAAAGALPPEAGFRIPGGADPVLVAHGLALENDPSEGAYPSGLSAIACAAVRLDQLGVRGMRAPASAAMGVIAPLAVERPISFGAALGVLSLLSVPVRQLVVVTDDPDDELATRARAWQAGLVAVVSPEQSRAWAAAGFELFEARGLVGGRAAAYLCENFVCRLPVTTGAELESLLR
jgi:uncharacterized protein YyaL (SSP411 family)